jgi:hypothetical protein
VSFISEVWMSINYRYRVCVCSCLTLLGAGVIAGIAAQQTTQRKASLREGPGSFFPVLTRVDSGTAVEVGATRGTWISAHVSESEGWLPKLAFQGVQQGIDYAGMLQSDRAVVISSVDIAAATKGAFEAKYSESYTSNFEIVDRLDELDMDTALVFELLGGLTPGSTKVLQSLPRQVYKNNVILQHDAEQLLGRAMASTLMTPGLIENADTLAYVNAVAAVVAAKTPRYQIPFRVAVIQDAAVNGFGLPGGYIVITEGLLRSVESEAELACLLGHEMAHVCLFHGLREFNKRGTHRKRDAVFEELDASGGGDDPFAELNGLTGDTTSPGIEEDLNRIANTSYLKIIGKRARADELEADLFGAAYAAAAGYDPSAMVKCLERVQSRGGVEDSFRHHPPLDDRISKLRSGIRRFRLARRGQVLQQARFSARMALKVDCGEGIE